MISDEQCSQPKAKRVESVLRCLTKLYVIEPSRTKFNKCRYMLSQTGKYSANAWFTTRAVLSVSWEMGMELLKHIMDKLKMTVKITKENVTLFFREEHKLKAVWGKLQESGADWVKTATSIRISR